MFFFTGSIIFNRDLAADEENLNRYKRRRAYAYTGSDRHFFRTLWDNSLKKSGFGMQNYRTSEVLKYKDIVYQDDAGRKFLQYDDDLEINYYDNFSFIHFLEKKVYFEQDGFFDPASIMWKGSMAKQRIADFLPYEYLPPER